MTFFDAAVAILRDEGRPLHYKKITELAVARSLLSHIGKTPEVTMKSCLEREADRGGGAIRAVRAGVFTLLGKDPEGSRPDADAEAAPAAAPARVEDADADRPGGGSAHLRRRRRRAPVKAEAKAEPEKVTRQPAGEPVNFDEVLARTRADLRRIAHAALERAVSALQGAALEDFVRAIVAGLGYRLESTAKQSHHVELEVANPSSFVPFEALVTIWHTTDPVDGAAIASLRNRVAGRGASHGVVIATGPEGFDASARKEAEKGGRPPIVLVDPAALATLAIDAGVGVTTRTIDVPVPDASWFGPDRRDA